MIILSMVIRIHVKLFTDYAYNSLSSNWQMTRRLDVGVGNESHTLFNLIPETISDQNRRSMNLCIIQLTCSICVDRQTAEEPAALSLQYSSLSHGKSTGRNTPMYGRFKIKVITKHVFFLFVCTLFSNKLVSLGQRNKFCNLPLKPLCWTKTNLGSLFLSEGLINEKYTLLFSRSCTPKIETLIFHVNFQPACACAFTYEAHPNQRHLQEVF